MVDNQSSSNRPHARPSNGSKCPSFDVACVLLFIGVFAYLCIWALPLNVESDGLFHLNAGRAIADTGGLISVQEHTVAEPINYPETHHVMLALLYMVGDEALVKLFAPVCGAIVALFIFALVSPINRVFAVLSSAGAIALLTHEFIQPYIEPYLLACAVASMYFFRSFLSTMNRKYLLLTVLFLGIGMSVKQQGLYLYGTLSLLGLLAALFTVLMKRQTRLLFAVPVLVVMPVAISFAPLADLLLRNGTLLVHRVDLASLGDYHRVVTVIKDYLVGPPFWQNPSTWLAYLLVPAFLFFSLGLVYLWKRDKILLSILLSVLLAEVVVASCVRTGLLIRQYHVIGLSLVPIFLLSSPLHLSRFSRLKSLSITIMVLLAILMTAAILSYEKVAWRNYGRCDDAHVAMYKEVGERLVTLSAPDAIFLAGSPGFLYHSLQDDRRRIWIPSIFECQNELVALDRLADYDIDYVFLETRQIEKESWWIDYVPSQGLVSYIDQSPHFEERLRIGNDNRDEFILYEVMY